MRFSITPLKDKKIIVLKVQGEINRAAAMKQNLKAHALGKKMGINRYLVDVTEAKNVDSIQNNYEFAYKDMNEAQGIDRSAIVATLVSPEDDSHNFIETVARNAGLNVTLFTDRDLAIQHLLKH